MRLLKVFKGKPLKRAELKAHSKNAKVRLRASRTGGANAAYHPVRGITFNTKYGVRASKTFKGLTLGFQGKNAVFRGRWSSKNGLLNTNLSRSGLSFSTKSKYGTYNWTKPNYSSFKFAGIQLRGKNAAGLAFIFAILTLIPALIKFAFNLLVFAFRATVFIVRCLIFLFSLALRLLGLMIRVLFSLSVLILNVGLFLFWDLPRQLFNIVRGNAYFDLEQEAFIESENEKISLLEELEAVDAEKTKVTEAITSAENTEEDKKQVEEAELEYANRIDEIEKDYEDRRIQLMARIAEIDSELEVMEAESTKLMPEDTNAIDAQIKHLEKTLAEHDTEYSSIVRLMIILLAFLGLSFLLFPFSVIFSLLVSPSSFLEMQWQALLYLIAFAIASGVIGYFMSKPCWRMYKNARDNRMLNDLRSKL